MADKTKEQMAKELAEVSSENDFLKKIFNSIQDGISVLDLDLNILQVNTFMEKAYETQIPFVGKKCYAVYQGREEVCPFCPSVKAIESGEVERGIVPYPSPEDPVAWYELTAFPLKDDDDGSVTGIIEYVRDITEFKKAQDEQVQVKEEIIEAQQRSIQELSTPVIPVMDRIIVMPMVGRIDSIRAREITRNLLTGIEQHRAKVVILDVTGVSLMDTGIVNHLNKTIQAARLKGAHTIVTGISDAVAESIVDLGIDWSDITTLSDLQTGLTAALNSLGIKLKRD